MKKTLILDDDVDTLNLLRFLLSNKHYKVKTIHSWEAFKTTVEKFMPDLSLIDIVLNGADGSEIVKNSNWKKRPKRNR